MTEDFLRYLRDLPIEKRLDGIKAVRDELAKELREKINSLNLERKAMNEQYDEEIGCLSVELQKMTGSPSPDQANSVGMKAYSFLLEHAGERFQAGVLMKAIGHEGAVASVVLSPYLEDGRVKHEFGSRARRYWIEADA